MFESLRKKLKAQKARKNWKKYIKTKGPNKALVYATTVEQAKMALDAGADINTTQYCWEGRTALMEHIAHNRTKIANYLIATGANVNIEDENGYTPLMLALMYFDDDNIELVNSLIAAGAKVNIEDKPLMHAIIAHSCHNWNIELIELLIAAGAKVNTKKRFKKSPVIKGISGVIIADKIAEKKLSGEIKGDITPEMGKKLHGQIAYDMIKTTQR